MPNHKTSIISKIKLSIFVTFALLLSATLFIACNNDETKQKTEAVNVEEVLFARYKLVKSENPIVNISTLNAVSMIDASNNVAEYSIENSSEKVLVITNSSKPNNYIVIKGFVSNSVSRNSAENSDFEITKELNIEIQMNVKGDGSINVKNITDNEEFTQTLVDGNPTEGSTPTTSSRVALCQREPGEGTKQCYLREVDEFCDGFIGCVALTQASVHILIAALCTC